MSLLRWLFGPAPSEPGPMVEVGAVVPQPVEVGTLSHDDARSHVERFARALEQNEAGPEKDAELRRHLAYWQAVHVANESKP